MFSLSLATHPAGRRHPSRRFLDSLPVPGRRASLIFGVVLVATLLPTGTFALDLGRTLQLHGYGGWSFGSSDGNEYLGATDDGEYDNLNFALNLGAEVGSHYSFHAQVEWMMVGEEEEAEIDFVFAEYHHSDAFRFRIGKVKQPFGIYNEIFDVGTARPFLFLAQGIYGPNGNVAEGYLGAGATGSLELGASWTLDYDVYTGELQLPFDFQLGDVDGDDEEDEEGEEEEGEETTENVRHVVGGRLQLVSPSGAWLFGVSGYHGEEEEGDNEILQALGAHLSFETEHWTLHSEVTRFEEDDRDLVTDSFYVELAYSWSERWQIAVRWDESDIDSEVLEELPESLTEHQDLALAVSWWLHPQFVVRAELHQVEGNRFALPEGFEADDLDDFDDLGELETDSQVLLLGAQFSF